MKLISTLKTHIQGQYMHFSSYAPWRIKTAWVKALFQRAVKICSTEELLNQQIKKISFFMWYDGFPNYISKALLHRLKSNVRNRDVINEINNNKENKLKYFSVYLTQDQKVNN